VGALFRMGNTLGMFLAQKLFQPAICIPGIIDINRVIPLEHQWGLMPRELHDYRVVNPRLPHVCSAGVAQIMKAEVGYARLPAGIGKGLLNFLEGFSPLGEDPIMLQGSNPAGQRQYIISPIAKEDNPWL
jgi:hypothetical protein